MEVKEECPAKVNLFLRVKEKCDGYHKIETLMAPLGLKDYITIKEAKEFKYETKIVDDIVLKVVKLFFEKYKINNQNIEIILEKNIPFAAGLAGGSADAAGCLRALNRFYNLNRPLKELEEICNKVGSDVSYCLYNKLSYCTNRGEVVSFVDPLGYELPILLLKPKFGLSTKEVYQNYSYEDFDYNLSRFLDVLASKNIKEIENVIFNDLKKPALKISKELSEIVSKYEKLGIKTFQSGSGPTYFTFDISKRGEILNNFEEMEMFSTKIYL